jgi:hypothetical protein
MAKISTYSTNASPTLSDKLIGTDVDNSNLTKNFTISDVLSLGGGGTVESVAALTLGTSGTDLTSTVVSGTTNPVITLNVPTASSLNRGALSATDWSTFNNKQDSITLTVLGNSGDPAGFNGTTLNIPTPSFKKGSSQVQNALMD